MKKMLKISFLLCLFTVTLLTGCATEDVWEVPRNYSGHEGDVAVQFSFYTTAGRDVVSKADGDFDLMSYIDDVHILIFEDTDGSKDISGEDKVVVRNYIQYGVEQNVFLKSDSIYYVFAAANLGSFNIDGGGSVNAYFDSIKTYNDLQSKYVVLGPSLVPQKLLMTTDSVVEVRVGKYVEGGTVHIPLNRVQTKLELNIYNKVDPGNKNAIISGVYPVSFTGLKVPVRSFLMARGHDYAPPGSNSLFTSTQTYMLPQPEVDEEGNTKIYIRGGNNYTKQTVYGFIFENRQGNRDVSDVKKRKDNAPVNATIAQITSATDSTVLLTYVLPGKGGDSIKNVPMTNNGIGNFDIDRNCIYHLNVYINGINDVDQDSRRDFLSQLVILTLPTNIRRVDAHYMDIPAFLTGKDGYAKFQSGTCDIGVDGQIIYNDTGTDANKKIPRNWRLMQDTDPDSVRWLRFSWDKSYKRSTAKTTHYAGFNVDAASGATPILHFNEYIDAVDTEADKLPRKRSAVIRIGYVSKATDAVTYETGVASGNENVFYIPVSQYGLRTIGQAGGYSDVTHGYTSLLGVESVEEYRFYFENETKPLYDGATTWGFKGTEMHTTDKPMTTYDGKANTARLYADYKTPANYDPVHNTIAADYCMRKNRDEDEDGVISGAEVKWYLPTSAQLMQISLWRTEFNYAFNNDYTPFVSPYWSSNESDKDNAMVMNFVSTGRVYNTTVSTATKDTRNFVRCVRDIPGTIGDMIYTSTSGSNTFLAGNLTGHLPGSILADKTGNTNIAELSQNEILQTALLISRQYVRSGNTILLGNGGANDCSNYREGGLSGWRLPTQREMSFIYGYLGMINELLSTPKMQGSDLFMTTGFHWTITNDGNGGHFWGINFQTGASLMYQKNQANGYFRCVKDVAPGAYPSN